MNSVQITGRLTEDPKLISSDEATSVCRLRLAVKGMGRGDRQAVGYINATVFGAAGEAAARTLTKGWLVAVDGRLQVNEWTGQDDVKRHEHSVVGNVEFLSAPRTQTEDTDPAADTPAAEQPIAAGAAA